MDKVFNVFLAAVLSFTFFAGASMLAQFNGALAQEKAAKIQGVTLARK